MCVLKKIGRHGLHYQNLLSFFLSSSFLFVFVFLVVSFPFFFSVPDKGIRCQNVELFYICAPSSFDEYSFLVLLCFLFVCLCVCVHVYVHACACVRVRFCMSL